MSIPNETQTRVKFPQERRKETPPPHAADDSIASDESNKIRPILLPVKHMTKSQIRGVHLERDSTPNTTNNPDTSTQQNGSNKTRPISLPVKHTTKIQIRGVHPERDGKPNATDNPDTNTQQNESNKTVVVDQIEDTAESNSDIDLGDVDTDSDSDIDLDDADADAESVIDLGDDDFTMADLVADAKSFSVRLTLRELSIERTDSQGKTYLHWACIQANLVSIKTAIIHGNYIDTPDRDGETPLLSLLRSVRARNCPKCGDSSDREDCGVCKKELDKAFNCVRYLIDSGADIIDLEHSRIVTQPNWNQMRIHDFISDNLKMQRRAMFASYKTKTLYDIHKWHRDSLQYMISDEKTRIQKFPGFVPNQRIKEACEKLDVIYVWRLCAKRTLLYSVTMLAYKESLLCVICVQKMGIILCPVCMLRFCSTECQNEMRSLHRESLCGH